MDINGVEINAKVGNELSLYPAQLIIPAGEKRSVKVFWTGNEIPVKEASYRLIAEQLPIELEKSKSKKASIKVLLRYIAALYVQSENFSSDVAIKEMKNQGKKIQILVVNSGKKHQVLSNLNLFFTDDKSNKKILFTAEELKGMAGENILADSKRIFSFNKEGKFALMNPTDKVTISFDKD
jgi:fimbrial chaperone protein